MDEEGAVTRPAEIFTLPSTAVRIIDINNQIVVAFFKQFDNTACCSSQCLYSCGTLGICVPMTLVSGMMG